MSVKVEKNSRLKFFNLADIDGIEFWAIDELPELGFDDTDNAVTYKEYDLVDVIAYNEYKDEVIWWGVSILNQWWDSLRSVEKYSVKWVDNSGFSNERIVFGAEIADDFSELLENNGISPSVIEKDRVFDAVRIASTRRMFGLLP